MRAIQCKYSCFQCGIIQRVVTMGIRRKENVVEWIEQTAVPAIQRDHLRQSPACTATKLSELYIPVPEGTTRIGDLPPVN